MENFELYIATLILFIGVIYEVIIRKCDKKERNYLFLFLLSLISFTILDLMQFEYLQWIALSVIYSISYIYSNIIILKDKLSSKDLKYKLIICDILLVIGIIFLIIMMTPIYDTLIKPLFKSN